MIIFLILKTFIDFKNPFRASSVCCFIEAALLLIFISFSNIKAEPYYATEIEKPTLNQCLLDMKKLHPKQPEKVNKICKELLNLDKALKEIKEFKERLINES